MAIKNVTLNSAATQELFLCPAGQEHAVTCVTFCNYSISTVTISVYAVPASTGAVGDESIMIKDLEIPAKETFTFDTEKLVLSQGDRIHAVCSANNAVTSTISTMRVS
jgi:hypothetical protein